MTVGDRWPSNISVSATGQLCVNMIIEVSDRKQKRLYLKPRSLCKFNWIGSFLGSVYLPSARTVFFLIFQFWRYFPKHLHQQECIPVGCVPPARYRMARVSLTETPPGQSRDPLWTEIPLDRDPPVNRMTNRCKNITLPQTSFAGGSNSMPQRLRINVSSIELYEWNSITIQQLCTHLTTWT